MTEKHKSGSRSLMQGALGLAIVVGFFSVLVALFVLQDPQNQQGYREARLLLIGALQAALGAVLGYYFGSTSGSDRKTEMLANSTPTPASPVTVTTTSENGPGLTTTTNTDQRPTDADALVERLKVLLMKGDTLTIEEQDEVTMINRMLDEQRQPTGE